MNSTKLETRIHCGPFDAHPNTYITSIHILSAFSVIINSLSIYCIYAKSPPSMQKYKNHLLPYQAVAFFLDQLMCFFTIPVFFVPVPMGYPGGLLFYLSWSVHAVTIFCLGVLLSIMYITLELFFYRYQAALLPGSRLKLSTVTYYSFVCILYLVMAIPLITNLLTMNPDQTRNKIFVTKTYDCYDDIINLPRLFVYCLDDILIGVIEVVTHGIFFIFCICIFVFLTYRSLSGSGYSNIHIKQQKSLLFYLCIQTAAPIILIFFPFSYFAAVIMIGLPVAQDIINFCVSLIWIHGCIGSGCLIVAVGPYRRFVFGSINNLFIKKKTSEVPSHRNSVVLAAIQSTPKRIAPIS